MWNERSLEKKGRLSEYQAALNEYFSLNHAEVVPAEELQISATKSSYLPAHGVAKADYTTTKLRIVFDGSTKSSTKVALNDLLLPTPNLYSLLANVLITFWTYQIAITGDISKMFREIALNPEDKDLHQFIRRDPASGRIQDCRMKCLMFGISSSPYLATRVLLQLAADNQQIYPQAAEVIRSSFICLEPTARGRL